MNRTIPKIGAAVITITVFLFAICMIIDFSFGSYRKQLFINVAFQQWLKSNKGKTYKEAIAAYYRIIEDKKKRKTKIDKQFEYNTYIRDFFEDNQGKSLEDAIKCWKYKKQLQGHNRYEKTDLIAIE